jgi:glycine cleavage system aminomethyltransferase T
VKKYGNRVPVRENEWDNRHFWRVSNAEHLAMSEDCGIVNLSHFYMFDVEGPDHVALMEWICAAKIGGDPNIGKGIYTHFLDDEGMMRADLTVIRMADRCRVIDGADAGPRDLRYVQRLAQDKGFNVTVTDVSEKYHHRHLGPNARATLQKLRDPNGLTHENFRSRRSNRSRSPARPSPASASPMSASGLGIAHEIRGRPRGGTRTCDRRDGVRRRDRQQPLMERACRTPTC